MLDSALSSYEQARKFAKTSYMENVSAGRSGYLPSLDGILGNAEIANEVNIGIIEIPLKKIVGTYSHSRASAFAANFMPLAPEDSEFSAKWKSLYSAHLNEGIRDYIVAYEYLNWFYVKEGNKRVSILKYFDAASVTAEVRRLIPKKDDSDIVNSIYYEFLTFNRITGISSVWFSEEGGFTRLLEYMENYKGKVLPGTTRYDSFMSNSYEPFRSIYHSLGAGKLKLTTGDAFLKYLDVYGDESFSAGISKDIVKKFVDELENIESNPTTIVTEPVKDAKKIFNPFGFVTPRKDVIKAAFVYAKNINESGWTYSHELGRLHVANVFSGHVVLDFADSVPENSDAYETIKKLAEAGNELIFTTSPTFLNPTLKAALEFPKVKFFNCSEANSYKNVVTFFGRIHEARYLMGIIAGSLTRTNKIGYIARCPMPEVIESVNAFALGVKLVNPYAEVVIKWMNKKEYTGFNPELTGELLVEGVDIINGDSLPVPGYRGKTCGLFSTTYDDSAGRFVPSLQYAIPIWHWGVFYEKVIRTVLNGTWGAVFESAGANVKPVNFWWGMDSGLVDIFYSLTHVPRETQRLIDFLKKMIIQNEYPIFSGPIYDQNGELRVPEEHVATFEQIFNMNWLVDNITGSVEDGSVSD